MRSINSLAQKLFFARQGENGLRSLTIDVSPWLQQAPGLTITVAAVRPTEATAYIPANVVVEDGVLTWTADTIDTAIPGTGLMLVRGTDTDGNVIKSAQSSFVIEPAFDDTTYEPTPVEESWLTNAEARLAEMLEGIGEATETAETVLSGYVDGLKSDAEAAIGDALSYLSQQAEGYVTDWLEENITQETGYVLDAGLTEPAAAAQAKAVGDRMADIERDADALYEYEQVASGSLVDVTDYQGEKIGKVTSTINVSAAISSVQLFCAGKNHLVLKEASGSSGSFTWTNNPATGAVTLNGTTSSKVNLFFGYNNNTFGTTLARYNTKWRASIVKSAENDSVRIGFNGNTTNADTYTYNASKTDYSKVVSICIPSGTTCDNLVVYPMLEYGDYPQEVSFEPFSDIVKEHTFVTSVTSATVE